MPEIDEAQLATLQNIAGFVRQGLANPKTRRKLLEAQKELYPDQAIPEIDAANPLLDELKQIREELAKDKEERQKALAEEADRRAKADLESAWSRGRAKLAEQRYSEEAIAEVEKIMHERNIFDHEAAAALYEKMNPPPEPVMTGSSRFDWFDGPKDAPNIKDLWEGNYDAFLAKAIPAARQMAREG